MSLPFNKVEYTYFFISKQVQTSALKVAYIFKGFGAQSCLTVAQYFDQVKYVCEKYSTFLDSKSIFKVCDFKNFSITLFSQLYFVVLLVNIYLQKKLHFSLKVHQCRFENFPICSRSYENNTLRVSQFRYKKSSSYIPVKFAECLFTNAQKQQNMLKISLLCKKIQTLRVNNSRILTVKNVKFSGYYFYMNANIW